MQNVTAAPFFLSSPGEPPIKWKKWKVDFERYAKVCGPSLSAERKCSLLLHCLGSEGQDIFDDFPDLPSSEANGLNEYEISIKKLDLHFLPKVSTILERYQFTKCMQNDDETIETYVTRLRKLASLCKFGALIDERIRDQFMFGCGIEKVRDELWLKDEPPLEEVLAVAKRIEHSLKCVAIIKKSTEKDNKVQVVKSKSDKYVKDTVKSDFKKTGSEFKCFRCGKSGHLANDKKCPALKQTCSKCKLRGHVTALCKTKIRSKVKEVELFEKASTGSDCDIGVVQTIGESRENPRKRPNPADYASEVSSLINPGYNVVLKMKFNPGIEDPIHMQGLTNIN